MIARSAVISALVDKYGFDALDERLEKAADSACAETEASLKNGAEESAYPVISLAAARAYYLLSLDNLKTDECVTSFKAGDVSITLSPQAALENAQSEYEKMRLLALGYLKDDEFVFRRVKI